MANLLEKGETQAIQEYQDSIHKPAESDVLAAVSDSVPAAAGRCSEAAGVPAAAGRRADAVPRRIVELCTSADSAIGRFASKQCEVIRITKDDDLLSPAGFRKAMKAAQYEGVFLVISLDCVGGCAWQNVNAKQPWWT